MRGGFLQPVHTGQETSAHQNSQVQHIARHTENTDDDQDTEPELGGIPISLSVVRLYARIPGAASTTAMMAIYSIVDLQSGVCTGRQVQSDDG